MSDEATKLISNIKAYIFNPIIGFMFAVAVVMFIYGIVEYIWSADNEDKVAVGKKHMIWGIVGMSVMVAVYGILNILSKFWLELGWRAGL
ncbi:MAG: hypothetical protein A2Z62_01025 [Candidatus Terrybacteria bacterium RIFCSPLOWO2_02_42_20]|uniref:Uncharacterized protein n=2 Tax=Candidatus Terryibacteriota TaxID=1817920 RepID=A0A1G2PMZ6_9BACT|nr:MAG: hypothetical protein A2W59_02010 [Candidatus Terrybacteria bacterium RIFCSPHIGHO2_02_41_19]OHA54061.1 MAG: hypothetical protein A2Z62_01025 [Candidatus Terrybacteria bacterium RIFCSPLOWO2_02_42_20]